MTSQRFLQLIDATLMVASCSGAPVGSRRYCGLGLGGSPSQEPFRVELWVTQDFDGTDELSRISLLDALKAFISL